MFRHHRPKPIEIPPRRSSYPDILKQRMTVIPLPDSWSYCPNCLQKLSILYCSGCDKLFFYPIFKS